MSGGLVKRDKILKRGTVKTSPLKMEAFEPLIIDGQEMMENVLLWTALSLKKSLVPFIYLFL